MSPLRAGLFSGGIGALVALVANYYPLYLDPEEMSGRLIAAVAYYRSLACLALYALLVALAAFEMRPKARGEPRSPLPLVDVVAYLRRRLAGVVAHLSGEDGRLQEGQHD